MCVKKDLEIIAVAISGDRHVSTGELTRAVADIEAHGLRMNLCNPHLDCFAPQRQALSVARSMTPLAERPALI